MKLTKLRIIILGILVLGLISIVGVFLFRKPIKATVNAFRAERLHEKARVAFEDELWMQASRQGTAAYYLDPDNKDIQMLVARAQLKQRMSTTVTWWNRIIDEPNVPVDELRELTGILLNSGELEDAVYYLNRLVELDGDNQETRRLWLQSLELQRQYGRAMNLAGQLAQGGIEDWSVHQMYMTMQETYAGTEGGSRVVDHLRYMIDLENELSLRAARELAANPDADREDRIYAVEYLQANAEDDLDTLYAASVKYKDNMIDRSELDPILERLLEEPAEGQLEEILNWSLWMGASDWFLETVSWDEYHANGGTADYYLVLLFRDERYNQLVDITERQYSDTDPEAATYLYYRAVALEQLGNDVQATSTLELAVQTADPGDARLIERYLLRDGRWELLINLYTSVLDANPDNATYQLRLLAAQYYLGRQEETSSALMGIDETAFEDDPGILSFILYLRLIVNGYDADLHGRLETLLVDFSEVFDYRLILGLSFYLEGQVQVARGFLDGMPPLTEGAPRYLRVTAILLGTANDNLILPGEWELLLPRERYLLSRQMAQSN